MYKIYLHGKLLTENYMYLIYNCDLRRNRLISEVRSNLQKQSEIYPGSTYSFQKRFTNVSSKRFITDS